MKLYNVSLGGLGIDNEIWVAENIHALAQTVFGSSVMEVQLLRIDYYRVQVKIPSGGHRFSFIEQADIEPGRIFAIIE